MFKFICSLVWASANCHMFSPCPSSIENNSRFKYSYVIYLIYIYAGCWFQTFFNIHHEPWKNNPIWLAHIFQMGWGKSTKTPWHFSTILRLPVFQNARILPRGIRVWCFFCAFFSSSPQKNGWFSKGITPKRWLEICRNLPQMFGCWSCFFFSHHGRFRTMNLDQDSPPASCSKNIWILYSGLQGCFFRQTTHAHTHKLESLKCVCIGCY